MQLYESILLALGFNAFMSIIVYLIFLIFKYNKQFIDKISKNKNEHDYKESNYNLKEENKKLELIIEHRQEIIENLCSNIDIQENKIISLEEQVHKLSSNNESLQKVARLYYDDVDHDKYINEREKHRITKAKLESAKIKIDKLHKEVL